MHRFYSIVRKNYWTKGEVNVLKDILMVIQMDTISVIILIHNSTKNTNWKLKLAAWKKNKTLKTAIGLFLPPEMKWKYFFQFDEFCQHIMEMVNGLQSYSTLLVFWPLQVLYTTGYIHPFMQ